MKIKIKDFQILEGEHEFTFDKGITIITGANASGKSTLFYALENCLTNPNGVGECITHNHSEARVTVQDCNNSVTWIRSLKSCSYLNDNTGELFVSASKLDSRDIANLGFYFDIKGKVMNIHNEWSVLFPFGESDTDMFRLFEDIFNISSSFAVIDEIKNDEQFLKSNVNNSQKEKQDTVDKLQLLKDIKEKVDVNTLNNYIESISSQEQKVSQLRQAVEIYKDKNKFRLVALPELFDVGLLQDKVHTLAQIKKDYEVYKQCKVKSSYIVPRINISLDIKAPIKIKDDYEQYCIYKASILQYEQELKELKDKELQIKEKLSQIKVCPTCGRLLEE